MRFTVLSQLFPYTRPLLVLELGITECCQRWFFVGTLTNVLEDEEQLLTIMCYVRIGLLRYIAHVNKFSRDRIGDC